MSDIRNMWTEGIRELENSRMYCTSNDKNNNEMDGVEVIDLCSVSQSKNNTLSEGKESGKQESQDKSKNYGTNKMEVEIKTMKNQPTTKKDIVESAMMCWEPTSDPSEEQPQEEPEKTSKKPVQKMEKQKHGEEHVRPTLDTSSRLNILIKEFSWEREVDGSTLEAEEYDQKQLVYITNLEDGLQKNGTKLYNEKGPNEKKPAARNRPIEEPSLNNINHVFDFYEESGSDVDYIEDSLKGENKKNSKEDDYTNMDVKKEGKQADLLRSKIT